MAILTNLNFKKRGGNVEMWDKKNPQTTERWLILLLQQLYPASLTAGDQRFTVRLHSCGCVKTAAYWFLKIITEKKKGLYYNMYGGQHIPAKNSDLCRCFSYFAAIRTLNKDLWM